MTQPVLQPDGTYICDGDPQPECFGEAWNGATGKDGEECRNCAFGEVCLDRFVQTTLPKAEGSLGRKAPLDGVVNALPSEWEISPKAVAKARDYRDEKYPEAEVTTDEAQPEPKPEPSKEDAVAPRKKAPAKKEAKKSPPKKAATKKTAPKKAPPKKASDDSAPQPAKKKAATKSRPRKAPPRVKSAKGGAKSVQKSARTAKAQAGSGTRRSTSSKKLEPWGEHTFLSRWTKERERSPLIAKTLPVNASRTVEWPKGSGKTHTVRVNKGSYTYQEQKFPTLYKVTEFITKEGSKWSGPKFWGLRKLAKEKGLKV